MPGPTSDSTSESPVGSPSTKPSPKHRLFPGWIMLGFSAGSQFMSAPGQSFSVAAYKKPMQDALGISETTMSFAYGVATIISGLLIPATGRLVDRLGARVVLPIAAGLLSLACWLMSQVSGVPSLFVGFTLIRCLGQGAMWLIGTWIVGEWFLRKRGFATALSGFGSSISVMCFPILNLYLIDHYGWQVSWQVLGLIVAATIVIPAAVFLRSRPEDIGLHPDGIDPTDESLAAVSLSRAGAPTEENWSLNEVLRDPTFWKLLSCSVCSGMIGTGLVFHQETILAAHGISKSLSMWLITFQALIGTGAAFAAGSLTDRYPAEKLLSLAMLMLGVGVGIICVMPVWWLVFGFAILNGLHGAIQRTAGSVVWVNYYGRSNQGVIRGAAMSAMILAAAIGPIPLAMANDRWGTYTPALIVFTIIPLMSMVLVATAKQPVHGRPTPQSDA